MESSLPRRKCLDNVFRALRNPIVLSAVLAMAMLLSNSSFGQMPDFSTPRKKQTAPQRGTPKKTQPKAKPTPVRPQAKRSNKSQNDLPAPENVTLTTKDGVQLVCTWFAPGGKKGEEPDGKTVAPFILLHDWDGSRQDLLLLGRFLQISGQAAIVPDLRGHGESLTVEGVDEPLDRERFRKREYPSILKDIEKCKQFLIEKNDATEVNIDLLNVVAVGQTSVLAIEWVIGDWNWPPIGSQKQGQDVKSLVLISPRKKFKGLSLVKNLQHRVWVGGRAPALPLLIVYGENDAKSAEEAQFIFNAIDKPRKKMAKANADPDADEQPAYTLVKAPVPGTSLGGSEMVASPRSKGMFGFVAKFVQQTVLSHEEEFPWKVRKQ